MDARGESETNEESEHIEHETETIVMGDSVGWNVHDYCIKIMSTRCILRARSFPNAHTGRNQNYVKNDKWRVAIYGIQ